jgi:hypothetical protein
MRSLIDDLALNSSGIKGTVYIDNKEYSLNNKEKVWSVLTENIDLKNDYNYCHEHGISVVRKVSFSYTSSYISAISGSIGISENGYISTNIGRNTSYFYIGEDKAKEIIDYVITNSIK